MYSKSRSQKFTNDGGTINKTQGTKKQYIQAQYLLLIKHNEKITTTKYISIGKPIKIGIKLNAAFITKAMAKKIAIRQM